MPTKAGRMQLKDLKQGKQMWMVHTRSKPVYDHILHCDLPNIRMVKIMGRPVSSPRMSMPGTFTAYDLTVQETIRSVANQGCCRMFCITEHRAKTDKRLLVVTTISAPAFELFATRKAAEQYIKRTWRYRHKYLVQNDAFNLGTIAADFDGDEDFAANLRINTMLSGEQRVAFRQRLLLAIKGADIDGDALLTTSGMVAFDLRKDTENDIVKRVEQFWANKAWHVPLSYDNFILSTQSHVTTKFAAQGVTLPTHDEDGKPVNLDVYNMFPGLGNMKTLDLPTNIPPKTEP